MVVPSAVGLAGGHEYWMQLVADGCLGHVPLGW
jgi:hypothetical protein